MLITFSSKSHGDVLMLKEQALLVVNAAGRHYESMPAQGVFTHAQLTEAIAKLEGAIDNSKRLHGESPQDQLDENGDSVHPIHEDVNLARRAYPLLQMMRAALEDLTDEIVWREGTPW